MSRVALWVALGGVMIGCGGSQPAPTTTTTAAPTSDHAEPDRGHHMLQTFWMAVDARDAVIDGDLDRAKEAARQLRDHDYGDVFPADWRHWVMQMKQLADEVVLAGTLDQAALAVGALGVTCGNCHWQQLAGPSGVRAEPQPWNDPPEDVIERMHRHQLGAEHLWAGLITPSEEAWQNGTITLTRAPIAAPVESGEPIDPRMAEDVDKIRELAKQARVAPSHGDRGHIYGELIATCAHCHNNERRSVP